MRFRAWRWDQWSIFTVHNVYKIMYGLERRTLYGLTWGSHWSESIKDRAHLSTFKIFIFDNFSCFIVLLVFLVIVQSSELISVWFCEKWHFFPNFFNYHIFAIYVGGASFGLPTACRLIAVRRARLPSVDGLVVRCIKCTTMLNLPSQYVCNLFKTCLRVYQHTEALLLCFTYKKLCHEGFM